MPWSRWGCCRWRLQVAPLPTAAPILLHGTASPVCYTAVAGAPLLLLQLTACTAAPWLHPVLHPVPQSLVRGERVTLTKVDSFADGVAIKLPGAEPFRLCRELLDGVVMTDNSQISTAIKVGVVGWLGGWVGKGGVLFGLGWVRGVVAGRRRRRRVWRWGSGVRRGGARRFGWVTMWGVRGYDG